jgi:hypothetical protein
VHYLALPNLIVLGSVTDHRPLDGASQEGHRLVAYLHGLDIPALSATAPEDSTNSALTQDMKSLAQELIYDLALDPAERENLEAFVKTKNISSIQEWFVLSGLPIDPTSTTYYAGLAAEAVLSIPKNH